MKKLIASLFFIGFALVAIADVSITGPNSVDGPWIPYTPAVTCATSGSTTTTTLTGAYKILGTKTIAFRAKAVFGTNSACVGPTISIPFAPTADISISGREPGASGKVFAANITAGTTVAPLFFYDNTNPAANGANFTFNSTYDIP